jgi:Na+/proline symporter
MLPTPNYLDLVFSALLLAILLFLSVAVGFVSKKKSETFNAWLAGSRTFGPVITGLALTATWLSGWACLGLMGIVYSFGWSGMWLAGVWTLVGIIPTVTIFGPKLRNRFEQMRATTVPQLVGNIYDSKMVAAVASIIYIVLLIVYSVGQYKAAATAWHIVTGTSWELSILVSAIVMAIYMAVGGYTGTQWALAIQSIFIFVACVLLGLLALSAVGGIEGLNTALYQQDPKLLQPLRQDLTTKPNLQFAADLIGLTATLGLFVTMAVGFPHNVARFIGMRKITKRDLVIMTVVVFVTASVPWFNILTGLSARALFGAELFNIPAAKQDAAGPMVALMIGSPLSGLYVAAVFAAAISTLAGMVLVMSGSLTRDLIQVLKPNLSDRTLLNVARILTVFFSIIPITWVILRPPDLLAYLMSGAAVGMGCIFFYTLAVSLFWKGAHKLGAIACMIYGFAMTALGGYYVYTVAQWPWGNWWWATFIGCGICYFVFSKIGKMRA